MVESNKIYQADSLEFIKKFDDFEFDIIYCDPPYALGSEIIIRPDGKPDYKKAVDFMNKWDVMSGDYWEKWFKESFRVLKHGGYLIMFSVDRQCMMPKYYAHLAEFEEHQSIYWFFCSNFPKSTDLSKMIDRSFGAEREIIGYDEDYAKRNPNGKYGLSVSGNKNKQIRASESPITLPSTELVKKYEGYRYSISPLKQTNETILIFCKPTKTGSVLHDTLAMEAGDETITCSALNIDAGRVPTSEKVTRDMSQRSRHSQVSLNASINGAGSVDMKADELGRYPAQTFIECTCDKIIVKENENKPYSYKGKEYGNKDTSMFNGDKPQAPSNYNDKGCGVVHTNPNCPCSILDNQSKIIKSSGNRKGEISKTSISRGQISLNTCKEGIAHIDYNDTGGCSKILHKCSYQKGEHDIYLYSPKVSKVERNLGCEEMETKMAGHKGTLNSKERVSSITGENKGELKELSAKNNHPCLKPISLSTRVLSLFKTPNPQKILFPFAGVASEIIGGIKAGFKDWVGCEINEKYIFIAEARIKCWTEKKEEGDEAKEQALF